MKTKKLITICLVLALVLLVVSSFSIVSNAGIIIPKNEANLDLDTTTTTILDSKEVAQNYTLTSQTGAFKDVTKVKVEWEISEISATRKEAKVWDPEQLKWVDDDANDKTSASATTAEFTITNLSSVKVEAKVEFEAETDFAPEIEYTGVDATTHKTVINTVVKANGEVDSTIVNSQKVKVKLTPDDDDFASSSITTTATKYGTYTITLADTIGRVTTKLYSDTGYTTVALDIYAYEDTTWADLVALNPTILSIDGNAVYKTGSTAEANPVLNSNGATPVLKTDKILSTTTYLFANVQ